MAARSEILGGLAARNNGRAEFIPNEVRDSSHTLRKALVLII